MGHWLVVAIYTRDDQLVYADLLTTVPWVQWLTWLFQVMPVFFLVGGYVNGLSWQAAQNRQKGYAPWLAHRLQRLILPVLPVLAAWTLISLAWVMLDPNTAQLKIISRVAIVPVWFLVVYILIVLLVPLAYRAWRRYNYASFWTLVAVAALLDLVALGAGWRLLGWLNYLIVYLAIHQLGFAWQTGRIGGPRRRLLWAAGGLTALIALVNLGPYPVSMVSVQGEEISNSMPPNLTMLALGAAQTGLLLALEKPARRLLERGVLWTTTVLINSVIMTVFLWHFTTLILVSALALFTGVGLSFFPGKDAWWLTRPLWIAVLVLALVPFVAAFTRFERNVLPPHRAAPPAWQLLLGCALVSFGLVPLTLHGIPTESWPGFNLLALALPFIGAALVRFGPARTRELENEESLWQNPTARKVYNSLQTEIEKSEPDGSNIFADLGRPDAEAHLLKEQLVTRIERIIRQRKLKQVEAAALLGLSQPDVSRLLRGCSLERLLRLLTVLGRDVEIVIHDPTPHVEGETEGHSTTQLQGKLTVAA